MGGNNGKHEMGKCEKNRDRILSLLCQRGRLSIADVVAELNASEATVRRYFTMMEKDSELIRTYGGVCLPSSTNAAEYHFKRQSITNIAEKKAIGLEAAKLICSHDRLFFDSGTTVRECGNYLANFINQGVVGDVSIETNSLVYSEELAKCCRFCLLGGTVRMQRMDLCGLATLENMAKFNFTKALLGADGISPDGQLYTTDEDTSLLATAALRQSQQVFILADASKLGNVSFAAYGTLKGPSFTLITDGKADRKLLDQFRKTGVNIVIAGTTSHQK